MISNVLLRLQNINIFNIEKIKVLKFLYDISIELYHNNAATIDAISFEL